MEDDSDGSENLLPMRAVGSQHSTPASSSRTSPASSVQDLHAEVLESRDSPIVTDGPRQASDCVVPALEIRLESLHDAAGSDECPVTDRGSDPAEPLASAEQPHLVTSTGASSPTHWSGPVQAPESELLLTLASSPEVQTPVHIKPAESPRETTAASGQATPDMPNLPPSSHDKNTGGVQRDKSLPADGAKAAAAPDVNSNAGTLLLGRISSVKADSHTGQSAVTQAAGTAAAGVKKPLPASPTPHHDAVHEGQAKRHSSLREKPCLWEDSTLRLHPFCRSLDSLTNSNAGLRLSTQAELAATETEETPTGGDIRSQQDLIRQRVRGDGVRAARRCKSGP